MNQDAGKVRPARARRARLAVEGGPALPGDGFEILAITAGEGNGWHFGAEALRASLPLWDGAACFIDHERAGPGAPRSVRDLAGVITEVRWDEARAGVRARLKPLGPSGPLARALGRELLAGGAAPQVGFSADVLFAARGREVTRILKVLSVDVVIHPARGGQFLQWAGGSDREKFAQLRIGEETMTDDRVEDPFRDGIPFRMSFDEGTPEEAEAFQVGREYLQDEPPVPPDWRAQFCAHLLETALSAARLPAPAAERIRRQFAGRAFEPHSLDAAIADARRLVGELTGAGVIQGPGRVQGMWSSEDRLQAAVDDLFGAPRDKGMESVQVERLQGIRELYLLLTGDVDLHGGYDPQRARLATTADFTGLVKNAMNKVVADKWAEMGRAGYNWWEKIVTVEHAATLNDLTGILVGTVGDLPVVAEGAEYTELPVGDSAETAAFTKYGGYIPLTLELIDRDETRKLREYPRALAAAGLRKISALVAGIFTANSGAGPTMADGGALFNSTAVTTAGGHGNLRTAALSAAEWDAVQAAVYNQPLLVKNAAPTVGVGPKMGINPRYLLVPRALQLAASKILYPFWENAANITSENLQRGQPGDVITVPEWTDSNDWAAVCDPRVAPAIYIGERFGLRPEIYIAGRELSPAVFMNDEHRLKVRHFLAVLVADYRPLHKSSVTG